MMRFRSNRVLSVALALSLLVHVVVALVARNYHAVQARDETLAQPTVIVHLRPSPPPTPVPTPEPKVSQSMPQRAPETHPRVTTPHITTPGDTHSQPIAVASPSGPQTNPNPPSDTPSTATPEPSASPTPRPQCSTPFEQAHAIMTVEPQTPDGAAGVAATVQIQVTLSQSGSVVAANVYHSDGNFELNRAALSAARSSTYAPEIRDCKAVGGTYLFTATFQ